MALFDSGDIIQKFKELEAELGKLWCFAEACCEKVPVNIGTGASLYKRLYRKQWEFKTILAGDNISITEQDNTITITGAVTPITCDDIDTCLGISPLGDPLKFLNEQGDFVTTPSDFITAIADTATINLTVTGTTLSADFSSLLISQFTNDVPYLTAATVPLTSTYVGYGSVGNTLTGNNDFTYDLASSTFSVGFALGNTLLLIDENNYFYRIGGTSGGLQTEFTLNGIFPSASLYLQNRLVLSIDIGVTETYTLGDVSGANRDTKIIIDDSLAELITLDSDNGVIVSNLAGVGTRMVTASATGLLSTSAIPTGTVTSVDGSGGTTGLTLTGGPITTTGTLTLGGTLITSNGGTGLSSYTQGDLLYYDSSTALSKLAKDTNATRYLSNQGTNNNPAWAQVDLTNGVTGVLPSANGGSDAWVDYSATSTIVGWSAFTTKILKYKLIGGNCMLVSFEFIGTSNSTSTTFTLPVTIVLLPNTPIRTINNGAASVIAICGLATSGSTVTLFPTTDGGLWTAAGDKLVGGSLIIQY